MITNDLCHVSCVTCHKSYVMCHVSRVVCHVSSVINPMSCVMCHMSPMTRSPMTVQQETPRLCLQILHSASPPGDRGDTVLRAQELSESAMGNYQ